MNENEKLRGIYQTIICMSCGKAINHVDSEIIVFVCDECLRPDFSTYDESILDMSLNWSSIIYQPSSLLQFTIKYTCPKCKKGKCETKTTQQGEYTFIVCKNFQEFINRRGKE